MTCSILAEQCLLLASLLGARTLLGAPGLTTRSKDATRVGRVQSCVHFGSGRRGLEDFPHPMQYTDGKQTCGFNFVDPGF